MSIVNKALATIREFSMFSHREVVLLALSGGPDSVCLTHVLVNLPFPLTAHAIYIDHGLRPHETPAEIAFCEKFCKSLAIPFYVKKIEGLRNIKANRQAAARDERYHLFEEKLIEIGGSKIVLGHNRDDLAETILMNLFRGAGPAGLAGIPPVRKNIVRPLIHITRSEIETYLDEHKLNYMVDSSNLKQDYLRNRVRLSLIPLLCKYNPSIVSTLSTTAHIMREENSYMDIKVTKKLITLISRKGEKKVELFLSPLEVMEKVILRRVLIRAVHSVASLKGIQFPHIEDMLELIKKGKSGDRIFLPGGIRAIKGYATFIVTAEEPLKIGESILTIPGEAVIAGAGIILSAMYSEHFEEPEHKRQVCLDGSNIETPLKIRPRRAGDFFYPLGFGKRKKLQDFFVDEKVPRDERDSVPLVFSGDNLLWIAGYRGDERFKGSDTTKRWIKLEMKKALVG